MRRCCSSIYRAEKSVPHVSEPHVLHDTPRRLYMSQRLSMYRWCSAWRDVGCVACPAPALPRHAQVVVRKSLICVKPSIRHSPMQTTMNSKCISAMCR